MGYDEPRLVWTSLNICGIEYYHTTHRVPIHNSQSTKTPPRAHGLPPWKVPNKALSLSLMHTHAHTQYTIPLSRRHIESLFLFWLSRWTERGSCTWATLKKEKENDRQC